MIFEQFLLELGPLVHLLTAEEVPLRNIEPLPAEPVVLEVAVLDP